MGPGHAIYSRKSSLLDASGFEESGVVLAWTLRGGSCGRYASRRESGSIRQLSLQSKFLPSFRERCSPPNPESASIGRNLGWRNCAVSGILWKFRENPFIRFSIVSLINTDTRNKKIILSNIILDSRGEPQHPENVPPCSLSHVQTLLKIISLNGQAMRATTRWIWPSW